jgi:hypothetical protein
MVNKMPALHCRAEQFLLYIIAALYLERGSTAAYIESVNALHYSFTCLQSHNMEKPYIKRPM